MKITTESSLLVLVLDMLFSLGDRQPIPYLPKARPMPFSKASSQAVATEQVYFPTKYVILSANVSTPVSMIHKTTAMIHDMPKTVMQQY